MKFSVECDMKDRWVPQFLGMLKTMQRLGRAGSSRSITFYADGDGDFQPKFEWSDTLPAPEKGLGPKGLFFDAG